MINFKAVPLEKYSSLHKISFFGLKLSLSLNCNLQTSIHSGAQLSLNLRDADTKQADTVDFSINQLQRWRMNIANFKSFTDYLQTLKSNHAKNYKKTQNLFERSGAKISLITGDWSQVAEKVYQLYLNVAKRHQSQLYDLSYFKAIAKIREYQLICIFNQDEMISVLIILDEEPVYHSMLVGFDYVHSKKINAYSLLHYEFIRLSIATGKHSKVDAGITASKAKSMLQFMPINSCMDISAKNYLAKKILRLISKLTTINISEEGKLHFKFF